jgi:hypothetical protein
MKTHVFNLNTGQWITYFTSPTRAVIAAFEQSRGNFNTWAYPADHPNLEFAPSGQTVFCGDFGALLNMCPLLD